MKRKDLLFLLILLLGTLVRIVIMQNRDLFVDEVYYWRVAQMNSWKNLLFITHWIKDHGILYYLWIKALAYLVADIPTLRFSNIVLYVLTSGVIYGFLKDKYSWGAVVGVALFSFHRYFVYLSSTLSPYNLVVCLAAISLCGLYSLRESKRSMTWKEWMVIVLATVGAFYTDYSFFFTLPFYGVFFLSAMRDTQVGHNVKQRIMALYITIFLGILPGLIQFTRNLNQIQDLFAGRYFEQSFFQFTYIMGGMMFLRAIPLVGVIFMVVLVAYFFPRKGDVVLFWSYITGIFMIFVSQRFFFPLFAERYLWFLYFVLLMMMVYLVRGKTVQGVFLVVVFAVGGMINYSIPRTATFRAPGDISYEVRYSSFLMNERNDKAEQVILLDTTTATDVFLHYYFGQRYPDSDPYREQVKRLKQKVVVISQRSDDTGVILKTLLSGKRKSCILYYVTDTKENVLQNRVVRQFGCGAVYQLNSSDGYKDTFELLFSKKP